MHGTEETELLMYPVLVWQSSWSLEQAGPEGKIVVIWCLPLSCLQHKTQGLVGK